MKIAWCIRGVAFTEDPDAFGQKPVPVSISLPQIPRELIQSQIRAAAVRNRRLHAALINWLMVRRLLWNIKFHYRINKSSHHTLS